MLQARHIVLAACLFFGAPGAADKLGARPASCDAGLPGARQWCRANQASLNAEQEAVLKAIRHAWRGYRESAWGMDDLLPISRSGKDWLGLGLTLLDSLDLLYLVGEDEEFARARSWVRDSFNPRPRKKVNFFETTIRALGGLLSAHYLTGGQGENAIFLERAGQLADGLSGGFNSPSGIPWSDVDLAQSKGFAEADSSLSEASSVQLEFKALAHAQGNVTFREMSDKAMSAIFAARATSGSPLAKDSGLMPIFLDAHTGATRRTAVTLGARGDSYYEYLLKQWLLTRGRGEDSRYLSEYQKAVDGIMDRLAFRVGNFTMIAELRPNGGEPMLKMDHLVCFLPGTLALGHFAGADPHPRGSPRNHLTLARELLDTCIHGYDSMGSGLAPEIWMFQGEPVHYVDRTSSSEEGSMYVKPADAFSLLRPETVESLFYLYRVTGDSYYRKAGWRIFQALEAHARVESGGYTSMEKISSKAPTRRDRMESFFMAETLKYLFLLFDDQGLLPLDKVVFNTEAHPLQIIF